MMGTETEQAPAMMAKLQKQHEWLTRLVGKWRVEGEANMGPDQPPEEFESTETVRSIGGLWTMSEQHGTMPGGAQMIMIATLGYDPSKGRYVGTFIASMMTQLWVYEGTLDAAQKALTLDTEGPNMMAGGKMAKFRDIIAFQDDDHRTLTSQMQTDDGEWVQVMFARYERVK